MATAMTVYDRDEVAGHCLCIAISFTSAAAANTLTIPAGDPVLDLTHAHPLIGVGVLLNEASSDASDSSACYASKEMKRGTAADSANEFGIASVSTISVYTTDKDGICLVSYRAGGAKAL